jgi:hypothetical protein
MGHHVLRVMGYGLWAMDDGLGVRAMKTMCRASSICLYNPDLVFVTVLARHA